MSFYIVYCFRGKSLDRLYTFSRPQRETNLLYPVPDKSCKNTKEYLFTYDKHDVYALFGNKNACLRKPTLLSGQNFGEKDLFLCSLPDSDRRNVYPNIVREIVLLYEVHLQVNALSEWIIGIYLHEFQARNQDFMWGGANEAKVDQTTEMYSLLSDPFI